MEYEIVLQIFSGGFLNDTVLYETVEYKLNSVLPRLPVQKVIMGWSPGKALYEKTADFLAKKNIEFYLWFPVFSETGMIRAQSPLADLWGSVLERAGDHRSEDFSFCCPNDPQNIKNIIDIFEREFAGIPFTGIFLDKIRYPSFAQGQRSVFTCFCPHCQAKYRNENFDSDQLMEALSAPASSPLGISAYRGGGAYSFEDNSISKFFELKAAFIFQGLQGLCQYFRGKGLKIGFDVFAPFLSAFTGQNLPLLSGLCDFMKPMMYRITNAPAGIPFELKALLRETNGPIEKKKRFLYDLLGLDPEKKDIDLAFVVNEVVNLVSSSVCPVYPGIEINRIKNLAEVHPDYVEETVHAYARAGIRSFVLSWDLLNAPGENIDAVSRFFVDNFIL